MIPAIAPMATAEAGVTTLQQAVIATSPLRIPFSILKGSLRPSRNQKASIENKPPAPAATIVFTAIRPIEASAATAFPDKRQRMLVAAIGVMVEAFMTALAMIIWSFAEPGVVRTGLGVPETVLRLLTLLLSDELDESGRRRNS